MGNYDLFISGAKIMRERWPELWRLCLPRHYVPPNGYPNTKVAASSIASQLIMGAEVPQGEFNKTMVDCSLLSWKLIEERMPMFFVGHDIIADLAQSEPPKDLRLIELQWPYEAMIFMLPEIFQRAYFKRIVPFVAIARQPTGLIAPPECVKQVISCRPMGIDMPGNHAFLFIAPIFFTPMKPVDYAGSWPMTSTVGQLIEDPCFYDATHANESGYLPNDSVPLEAEDIELTEKIFLVSLWLLMLMNAEPQHIELGVMTCERKPKHAHDPKGSADLWSPNFIGKAYVRTEWQGGTHASPRAHSRRGHWTHQPHGPARSLRKLLWIRRSLIGVKKEEAA